ncbi:hypothetical protein QTP70_033132 [Hemibagrus guttatus]|uniref:ribonuclease H n=1 Tax=Hemibagrus guttatus TaxID=175788 RepID=A0AAE0QB37_9TELE|nr:hypothetical protein QTP70_033132 [Hemibagrus guttatus]KAK3542689.1 hypothetical protein QTP86_033136 [Hemibagrus guttatus]
MGPTLTPTPLLGLNTSLGQPCSVEASASRYFIVSKKDGGLRPVLDLRALNSALRKFRFKVLTTKLIVSQIRSEDWFVTIDLKDAYFHIGVRPEHQKFLRFAFRGEVYQFLVLPFNLALSPCTFTKCMDVALPLLRLQGIHILNYLDDWLILAHSTAMAASHRPEVVLTHMRPLGLEINPEKCVLSPSQRTTFLGVTWDSTTMRACLSPAQVASILSAVNADWLDQSLYVAEVQRVLGLMAAAANVIPLGLLHMRPFQFWLRGAGFHPRRHPLDAIRVMRRGLHTLLMCTRPRFLILGPTLGGLPPRLHLYAFCPVALLPQVLARVHHDGVHILLVAPPLDRSSLDLVSLLDGTPWEIPTREDSPPPLRDVEALGLAPEGDQFLEAGLSSEVVETLLIARALSTRKLYALKWRLFSLWCAQREQDPVHCLIGTVLGFLQSRLSQGLSPSTLKVYVAAIAANDALVLGATLGRHPLVSRFLRSARWLRPSCRPRLPSWDLSVVLDGLLEAPFEPMESASERFLTLKMALLLALASLRWVGYLQTLLVAPACLEFVPGMSMSKAILHPKAGYVPKVPRMAGSPVILQAFCLPPH